MATHDTVSATASRRRPEPLIVASLAYAVANLLHVADHMRRGIGGLPHAILGAGTAVTILALVTAWPALRRLPGSPLLAAAAGLASAAGVAASHLAPHWSALSDPYPGSGVDALSWVAVLLEIEGLGCEPAVPVGRGAAALAHAGLS